MLIKKKNELLQIFEKTQNELKNTSLLFKNTNEESNTRISRLETELSALNDKYNQEKKETSDSNNKLQTKMDELRDEINKKNYRK